MAKRLAPSKETLIRLFAKSGNECSFDNCKNKLFNKKNNFIGQICHINSVKKNGTRKDNFLTSEELRNIENLILLCYEHHIEIDRNEGLYSVPNLLKMKVEHEKQFEGTITLINEFQINEVFSSYFDRIDEKLEKIIYGNSKVSHLTDTIYYKKNPYSQKIIRREIILYLTAYGVIINLIFFQPFSILTGLHVFLVMIITIFFLLSQLAFLPLLNVMICRLNRKQSICLFGIFYKYIEGFHLKSYSIISNCIFPNCSGIIKIKSAPENEKANFNYIGCCSNEPTLHTYSCENNFSLGRYYKMDFSRTKPKSTK